MVVAATLLVGFQVEESWVNPCDVDVKACWSVEVAVKWQVLDLSAEYFVWTAWGAECLMTCWCELVIEEDHDLVVEAVAADQEQHAWEKVEAEAVVAVTEDEDEELAEEWCSTEEVLHHPEASVEAESGAAGHLLDSLKFHF